MKRISTAIIFLFFTASTSLFAKQIALTPHAYLGFTNLGTTYSNDKQPDSRPLFQNMMFGAGLEAKYAFTKSIGIQGGINYMFNSVGDSSSATITILKKTTTTTIDSTSSYSSIDIPLLLSFSSGAITLEAGPNFSIPLGTLNNKITTTISSELTGSSTTDTVPGTINIKNAIIPGLLFGVEYSMKAGKGKLLLGGRYILDFSPVTSVTKDNDGNVISETALFTRRGLLLNVGYNINL